MQPNSCQNTFVEHQHLAKVSYLFNHRCIHLVYCELWYLSIKHLLFSIIEQVKMFSSISSWESRFLNIFHFCLLKFGTACLVVTKHSGKSWMLQSRFLRTSQNWRLRMLELQLSLDWNYMLCFVLARLQAEASQWLATKSNCNFMIHNSQFTTQRSELRHSRLVISRVITFFCCF